MSVFGNRLDGPAGRRRSAREKVVLLGTAISIERTRSVVIEDLSPTGAKICGRALPPLGQEVLIRAECLRLFGRVAWVHRNSCGIRLET